MPVVVTARAWRLRGHHAEWSATFEKRDVPFKILSGSRLELSG